MRRAVVVLGLAALASMGSSVARPDVAVVAAFQRPNLDQACTAFAALPSDDRVGPHLMPMATGLVASRNQPQPTPPPPQQASLEPPASPAPKADPLRPVTVTGSAFSVSAAADLVTNAHVVKGCASATITGRGTARRVAKDAKTDLAPLRLDTKPAAPLTPAVFRTTPLQLGEAVTILGFPTAGALDHYGSLLPREREKVARRSRDG